MIDAKDKLNGIYAITPPKFEKTKLLDDINICLDCGVKIFQIRYKEENFLKVAELNFDMIALSNAIFNSQDIAKSASFCK